jgi:3D (Asp-Asp-Asp) domain-containing protein
LKFLLAFILIIPFSVINQTLLAPECRYDNKTFYNQPIDYTQRVTQPVEIFQEPIPIPITRNPTILGEWVWAKVTAYTPHIKSCGIWSNHGITSTGIKVRSINPDNMYGIAANPKVIKYGTHVYVPGYHESLQDNENSLPTMVETVDDTGGGMRRFTSHWRNIDGERVYIKLHLDVRYRQESTAINWGTRYMRVFIYKAAR